MYLTSVLTLLALQLTSTLATPTPDPGQDCTANIGAGVGTKKPGDFGLNDNGDWYFVPVGCEIKTGPCGGACDLQMCHNPEPATDVSCIPGSTYRQLGDIRFCGTDGRPRSGGSCTPTNGCVNPLCG